MTVPVPFVGRDRELADLVRGLADAIGGSGRSYVIAGDPGIGKTALAERLAERATAQGARVVWGRAWEGGSSAPFWTWAQIIRELADRLDDEPRRSLLTPEVAAQLALLVPDLARHSDRAAAPGPGPDSDAGRFYLFEATARFLKGASSTQPLVLVLDDLLAGDPPSLLLLRFLLRGLRACHLLVVATYRDVAAPPSPEASDVLAELVREGQLLRLRGMDRAEVGRLVAEVSGTEPWEGKLTAIYEATEGNPLFVREVTRLVAAQQPLDQPGRLTVPVPDSVRAVIRRRLTPLSADAVQVLSAAAVVGRDFDLPLASAAADLSYERVLGSVSEAMALGVVRPAPEPGGGYRFSHPLMREVTYEGLPLPARTQMHQRVGEAIERLHGPAPASHLGELAYHFAQVASAGAGAKATTYGQQAGDRAMALGAYEDATTQYRRALEAAPFAGFEECRRGELLLRLGRAHAHAGDYQPARVSYLQAAETARAQAVPERLARAALGLGARQVDGGQVDRQLLALLREALDGLPPGDSPLRARLLARLSLELMFSDGGSGGSGDVALQDSLSRQAVAMSRRLGDVDTQASAYLCRWMAVWGPDGLPERAALSEELLRLARDTGDREQELAGRARRITCAMEAGDIRAVDSDLAVHARLAGELRMPYHEWTATTMRAGRALLDGSFEAAEQLAEQAVPLLPGQPNTQFAYGDLLAPIRWEQGRLAERHAMLQEAVERFPQAGFDRGWLSLAEAERGREAHARRCLHSLSGQLADAPRGGVWLAALATAALAAARLDDPDAASAAYPLLLPYAARAIVAPMPHPVMCFGSATFYLGLLAASSSRWDDAVGHFQAAIDANTRIGAVAFLARTRYEYARMLVRRGRSADRQAALVLLEQAEATAQAIGMSVVRQGCQQLRELAAGTPVAVGPATGRPIQAVNGTSVFRREGDYWTVVYGSSLTRLRDSKGLRLLARLLAEPGREFHAVDLAAAGASGTAEAGGTAGAGKRLRSDGLVARADLGDAGELLDARAKAEYQTRVAQLRSDLDEAESFHDPVRAAKIKEELDFITHELASAVGLGGRDRRAASHAERARLNVTRAIRAAIGNLARGNVSLGRHLDLTVRTGQYCRYAPDPRAEITWET